MVVSLTGQILALSGLALLGLLLNRALKLDLTLACLLCVKRSKAGLKTGLALRSIQVKKSFHLLGPKKELLTFHLPS